MSAYSASLSPVDETEEPPPFNAALLQSRSLLQAKSPGSSVSHPRHATKCSEAAIDSATEQKLWIQCTLNGVKHRGEDWIEPIFKDDETSGCSACLPDIVVVNDAVNKFSDAFVSKAPAPWQRILTKAEAGTQITNYSSRAHPEAACTMPLCNATCIPDTYLYNDKRFFFYVNGPLSSTNFNASDFAGGARPFRNPAPHFTCVYLEEAGLRASSPTQSLPKTFDVARRQSENAQLFWLFA
jgi:hypothetical protein